LVVAHKGVNRILIWSLLGFDVRAYRDRLDQSPAGVSILDFMGDVHAQLHRLNDVSHYEGVPARILTERLSAWWGTQGDA